MPTRLLLLLALGLPLWLLPARPAFAQPVVVVGERSPATQLSRRQVVDLFMGRTTRLPDGTVRPVDFPPGDALRQQFYAALTDRSEAQIDAYWAQLVFAGRMSPLLRAATPQEMAALLREDPQLVGYMPRDQVGRGLRIVFDPEGPR